MSGAIRRSGTRAAVLTFAALVLLGGIGLVVAGARERRTTAFSLDVPAEQTAASVTPGRRVCQGPIAVPTAFAGVRIWLGAVPAPGARLRVIVAPTPSARGLAFGSLSAPASSGIAVPAVELSARIAKGNRVWVCLEGTGGAPVPVIGSVPGAHSGLLTSDGRSLGSAATMIFVLPHSTSLLSSLPTIFHRASLFRPNWMHPWVYWVLLAGLLIAAGLVGAALAAAARADEETARADPV